MADRARAPPAHSNEEVIMFPQFLPREGGLRSFRRAHKAMLGTSVALALVLVPVAGLELARAQSADTTTGMASMPSLSPLVKKVMPAVVNISVEEAANVSADTPDSQLGQEFPPGSPFNEFMKR